jgi:hypothetical protein
MRSLGCLWNRSRLAAFADTALPRRAAAGAARHVAVCVECRADVERFAALCAAVKGAAPRIAEPDWSGFWPRVQSRLRTESSRPMREPWWRPFWKPVWGHPRMALATGLATAAFLGVSFWPGGEGDIPLASAAPVVVQDVATEDPDRSVMVYTAADHGPDRGVTVIWLFASDAGGR